MTIHQNKLLAYLQRREPTPAARALLKRSIQEFVLEYGWWYETAELPKGFALGSPQECHKNATDLTLTDDSLIYCERYSLLKREDQPTIHAWVTDGKGRAFDTTWPQSGVAYAGIPFQSAIVSMAALKNQATISLLDGYQNNYPLRGDLG